MNIIVDGLLNSLFLTQGYGSNINLTAGMITLDAISSDSITVSAIDATGGTAPYSYQWQQSVDGLTWIDSDLTVLSGIITVMIDMFHEFRLIYTDSLLTTVISNTLSISRSSNVAIIMGI